MLTASDGAITQYMVAEFSSLQRCEAEGKSHSDMQRPLHPKSPLQWYCMESL